jgi:hypothetical protein
MWFDNFKFIAIIVQIYCDNVMFIANQKKNIYYFNEKVLQRKTTSTEWYRWW